MLDNTSELSDAVALKIWMDRAGLKSSDVKDKWGILPWQYRKIMLGERESPLDQLRLGDLDDREMALTLRLELGFTLEQVARLTNGNRQGIWLMENQRVDKWGYAADPVEVTLILLAYVEFESHG